MNEINFQKLFEEAPGLYLILSTDLTIIAVSKAYLTATLTKREEIIGKYLFDVFPDNPDDDKADGVSNLHLSLNTVLNTGKEHTMLVQRYDIRNSKGIFEVRYWQPLNKPVLNEQKDILYIIHNVQDVTSFVNTQNAREKLDRQLVSQAQENEEIVESEKRLRNSLDKMLEGVQIIGFDWKYLYVNEAFTKHARYSKEELIGYTVLEKYPEIENTETYKLYQRCFNNRESIHEENEFKFPDGSVGWFELSFQPVPEGIVIRSVDITERKKLQDQQLLYALIVNSTNDAIISKNLDGIVTSWNHGAEMLFGYSTEEIMGKPISILVPDYAINEENETLERIKNGESVDRYETERLRKDGSKVYVSTTMSPIKDLTGKIIGASRIVQDISKRKKAEEEIFQLNKQIIKSEIRFRGLIENSNDIVTLIDENYTPLYRSPSTTRLTGWTDWDRKKSGGGVEQIHPDDIDRYKNTVKESLSNPGKPLPIELRALHKNGHYIWLEGTIMNMLKDQSVKGIIANYHDVTKSKEAEEKIIRLNKELEQKVIERTAQLEALNKELQSNIIQVRESEEKFSKIFESSPVGISIGSLKTGKILNVNKSFTQLTGYTPQELIGHSTLDLKIIAAEDRELIKRELMNEKHVRDKEIFVSNKSGEKFPVLISLDQFAIGNDRYGITIAYNISERKKAEEELLKANKELEAFTYSVSHDLRAPLRAINGYASILEEDYTNVFDIEAMRLLKEVQGNAKKMGTLIDDLLAFSRLGRKEIKRSVIDMNELVRTAIKDIEPLSSKVNINVSDLSPIMGDYSLMLQVLINLISNAVKYSSKNEKVLIEISSSSNEKEVTYLIKDNGVGFDMAYYHQLFGVFQRLHSADEFPGTGVGLAIVQRIIDKHKGKIWATSEINKGANFYFSLPIITEINTRN